MAHSYPALLLLDSTDANRVRVWGTASRAARCGGELFGDVVGATQAGRNPGSKFGGASRADETGSCSDKQGPGPRAGTRAAAVWNGRAEAARESEHSKSGSHRD
jgi:hypothetical protein